MSSMQKKTDSFSFFKYFFGAPHLATFILFSYHLHPSSMKQDSNRQPHDHESITLSTRPLHGYSPRDCFSNENYIKAAFSNQCFHPKNTEVS
jgi:hypothetical protein